MKDIADKFISVLISKIDDIRSGKEINYTDNDVKLAAGIVSENIEYYINDDNDIKQVSKDEFLLFGMDSNFEPKRDSERGFRINIADNKVVGYYEKYK
jgi:hypothetical protein